MTIATDRPATLTDMIGQTETIARLTIAIGGAQARGVKPPHVLLSGPAGTGKTTLAQIVADMTGTTLHALHAQTLSKKGDLASVLCAISPGDVVFIDEIHALPMSVAECLYQALEDGCLSIIVGSGPSANAITLQLPPMVMVGATTRPGALPTPLRDRFGVHLNMQTYTDEELAEIAGRRWRLAGLTYTPAAAMVVGSRAKGVPRLALALADRVMDCAALAGVPLDDVTATRAMDAFGVGEGGIDEVDYRILVALVETFGGAPTGLDALGAALDLDAKTIQAEHEPALTRAGLIMRTSSGRVATPKAHAMVRGR